MSSRIRHHSFKNPLFTAVFALAIFGAAACFCQGIVPSTTAAVHWVPDINVAMAKANAEKRPIFLHFTGNDCQPAAQMNAEIFGNPEIAAKLNAAYVMVKVNASDNPAFARQYSVAAIPTDLIMRPTGEFIHRRQGGIAADRFKNYLAYLDSLQQGGKPSPIVPEKITVAAPPAASDALRDPFTQQPVATNGTPNGGMIPAAREHVPVFPPPTPNAVPYPAVPNSVLPNPAVPNPAVSTVHNPLRTAEGIAPTSAPVSPSVSASVSVSAPVLERDVPVSGKMIVEVPLALDGFCPVTLAKEERWVSGNPAYCTMYQGHIFRFANAETMETFAQTPAAFVPMAMGEDVVLMVDRNKRVSGNRSFGASFNGRVFLFASKETLETFSKRPEYYAEVASKYETARKEQPTRAIY